MSSINQLAQRHSAVRGRLQHHVHASLVGRQFRRGCSRRGNHHRFEHRQPLQQRGERLPHPVVPAELVGFGGSDPPPVVRVLLRPRVQLLRDLHGEDVALAGSRRAGPALAALALEHPVPQGSSHHCCVPWRRERGRRCTNPAPPPPGTRAVPRKFETLFE